MKKKGFTYIEVMMAVAIFGLMFVFIVKLNSKASGIIRNNGTNLNKMYFAKMKAEQYKSNPSLFQNTSNSEIKNNKTYYYFVDNSDANYDVLVEWCWFDTNQRLRTVDVTVKNKNSTEKVPLTLEFGLLKSNN